MSTLSANAGELISSKAITTIICFILLSKKDEIRQLGGWWVWLTCPEFREHHPKLI
jgi:hypothetical protein